MGLSLIIYEFMYKFIAIISFSTNLNFLNSLFKYRNIPVMDGSIRRRIVFQHHLKVSVVFFHVAAYSR